MDKGLHEAFRHLTEALQYTRDKDVVSIMPCLDYYHASDGREYVKEVAEITFESGQKMYANIGGDANTTAMYDVLAVLCEQKRPSTKIERIQYIEEASDNNAAAEENRKKTGWALFRTPEGMVKNTYKNIKIIFEEDKGLRKCARKNRLSGLIEVNPDSPPPWPRDPELSWKDSDDSQLRAYLALTYGTEFSWYKVRDLLTIFADKYAYTPEKK